LAVRLTSPISFAQDHHHLLVAESTLFIGFSFTSKSHLSRINRPKKPGSSVLWRVHQIPTLALLNPRNQILKRIVTVLLMSESADLRTPAGVNANAVTGQALTDLGRAATFYDCLVEVDRN